MKLSEALRDAIRFDIRSGAGAESRSRQYLPFQGCVERAYPGATPDTFALAFSCPLFCADGGPIDPEPTGSACAAQLIDAELPEGAKLPRKAGIYFLCDAIDLMAVKLTMTESQIADVVARIEGSFRTHGLDWYGRSVGKVGQT